MTEEEKEAIESKRHQILLRKELYGEDSKIYKTDETILNYIEKLQKENEELKEIIKVPEEFDCACWYCKYDKYGDYENCLERKRRYLKEK